MSATLSERKEVRSLWRFTLRALVLSKADRRVFCLHAACRQHCTEREAVDQIRGRFTPDWWAGYLITEVEQVGDLHMIDGVGLYERD